MVEAEAWGVCCGQLLPQPLGGTLVNVTLSSLPNSPSPSQPSPKGSARLYSCCMDSDLPSQNFWDDLALAHKIPQYPLQITRT